MRTDRALPGEPISDAAGYLCCLADCSSTFVQVEECQQNSKGNWEPAVCAADIASADPSDRFRAASERNPGYWRVQLHTPRTEAGLAEMMS